MTRLKWLLKMDELLLLKIVNERKQVFKLDFYNQSFKNTAQSNSALNFKIISPNAAFMPYLNKP